MNNLNYETLLQEASDHDVYVIENAPFESDAKGLIKDDVIGLNQTLGSSAEKACVLAEELGHYHTSVGNIIDTKDISSAKQEYIARMWSYNKMIGLQGIIEAYKHKCTSKHDMADFLNVTEDFLDEAIRAYTHKYGMCTQVDNYVVFFTPSLAVMEMIA